MTKYTGMACGIALFFVLILFGNISPEHPEAGRTAAVAVLMAVWWITEAVPLYVTALLPIVLFPVLGIAGGKAVSSLYFNYIIFLMMGGFIVALAMQRWNLHKRIALAFLLRFGVHPAAILLGFMSATAFLSMWISNTATTMMMVPIALSVILGMEERLGKEALKKYSTGLFIAIAYSASIGGTATLIGTPPNLAFAKILNITFPNAPDISFTRWFAFAFPPAVLFLVIVWAVVYFIYRPKETNLDIKIETFREEYRKLGAMSLEEKIILADCAVLAFLWITRSPIHIGRIIIPGWSGLFANPAFLNDGTAAVAAAIVLFLIPQKGDRKKRIMDWDTASRIPWGILILLGGGFALASGFKESGLTAWLGSKLGLLKGVPPFFTACGVCLLATFLTELTSNTATTQILLPIVAVTASAMRINPLFLMVPATLSCSFAFMLPAATPPNAIVFGTGRIRIRDMLRTGIIFNLAGVIIVTLVIYFWGRAVFGTGISSFPEWAGI